MRIKTLSNLFDNPLIKGGSTQVVGVYLDTDPGGSINVSLASRNAKFTLSTSTLTFNSSNYNTAQAVTLTAVNDGIYNSTIDFLDVMATGYTSLNLRVNILYNTLHELYYRNAKWIKNTINISSQSDITSMRASLISTIFNGNGLPSNDTPDAISSFTGQMHFTSIDSASLVGVDSIDRLTWTWQDSNADTWTHYSYHIKRTGGATKLLFVCIGHGPTNEVLMINEAIADGYDVMLNCMPVTGFNTTDSSVVTLTGSNGHKQILNLDTGPDANSWTYNPYELYLFETIQNLNYLDSNYSYSYYDSVGTSGGHIQVLYPSAIDTRIRRSISNRCFYPTVFRRSGTTGYAELDYDGMGNFDSYTKCGIRRWTYHQSRTHFDLLILSTSGGRKAMFAGHYDDSAVGNNTCSDLWAPYLQEIIAGFGGELGYYMNDDPADALHQFHAADVTEFINFLN